MSNSTQGGSAAIVELENFITAARIVVASAALYSYEWIVTLDQEIKHIWRTKWILTTWIFFGNRYGPFLYVMAQLLPSVDRTSCKVNLALVSVGDLIQLLCAALFTGLRTSALCNRRVWVFLIVFVLGAVIFAINLFISIKSRIIFEMASPTNICENFAPFTSTQELGTTLALRLSTIMADVIALVVSYRNALGTVREAARFHIKVPLAKVLIQDGTALFLGLTVVNIYSLVVDNLPFIAGLGAGVDILVTFPPIFINRFMMNLRQASHRPQAGINSSMGHGQSSIQFNSDILIGNLDESLALGVQQEEIEEKEEECEGISDTTHLREAHCDLEASAALATVGEDFAVSSGSLDAGVADITEEARTL